MNMQRLAPYFGIIAALALGVFIAIFSGKTAVQYVPRVKAPAASSAISIITSGSTLLPIMLPGIGPAASVATSVPAQTVPTPKKITPPPPLKTTEGTASSVPVTASVPSPTPIPPSFEVNAALDAAASTLRDALVNIMCYAPQRVGLHSISGSGVIIDSKGIILTNAHIAQYFLLADRNVSCTIRAGSPAINSYEAVLIYIPSAWLSANADILTKTNPRGTGEYDFALLAITKSASTKTLPAVFPSVPLAILPVASGTPVVIATYGAQFLESSQVQSALFPTIVFGSVKDTFTFATNTIDVLALGGSAAAQEGSSGGGVADASGELVGTITTSTIKGTTDTRSLDAITASYIRAAYASETGLALDLLLAKPTATSVVDFAPHIPALEAIITANLP